MDKYKFLLKDFFIISRIYKLSFEKFYQFILKNQKFKKIMANVRLKKIYVEEVSL